MRKLLLFFIATLPLLAYAQQREKFETVNPVYQELLPLENDIITFSEVIEVSDCSKDELYVKANEWIIKTFNSAKDVIQFQDKETGKIVCKTIMSVNAGKGWNAVSMDIYYLVTIETREERYKITASNFIHNYNVRSMNTSGENKLEAYYLLKHPTKKELAINMEMAEKINNRIISLFDLASHSISNTKNENW